jgi:hypothetical protein
MTIIEKMILEKFYPTKTDQMQSLRCSPSSVLLDIFKCFPTCFFLFAENFTAVWKVFFCCPSYFYIVLRVSKLSYKFQSCNTSFAVVLQVSKLSYTFQSCPTSFKVVLQVSKLSYNFQSCPKKVSKLSYKF